MMLPDRYLRQDVTVEQQSAARATLSDETSALLMPKFRQCR